MDLAGRQRALRVAHAVFKPEHDHAERLAACRAHGVDMIEIDVLGPPHHDDLMVAHDLTELRHRGTLSFAAALDLVLDAGDPPFGLNVDLKATGYEQAVADVLRDRGLADRAVVSTMEEASLRALRAIAPELRLGWSVPRVKKDPFRSPFTVVPAYGMLQVLKRTMPRTAARAIRAGRVDAIMANDHLVTPALVRAVRAAGGELYVWTVDVRERVAALERLGVTGIITNEPALFQPTISQVAAE